MIVVRIPSALRPYADSQKEVTVEADSVEAALHVLTERFPAIRPHLYDGSGALRQYVNLFVNEQDVRGLQGEATPLKAGDRMMIVPSIAGGAPGDLLERVDHTALRLNQAVIILLLLTAFVADTAWLLAGVAAVMWIGTLLARPGFLPVYRILRRAGWVRPEVVPDHPRPHRFAQGLGASFLTLSLAALLAGVPAAGWTLAWIVIALAGVNMLAGFCAGCAVYYWLQRASVPGFTAAAPGSGPVRRPRR